jgi:hypothetical protein
MGGKRRGRTVNLTPVEREPISPMKNETLPLDMENGNATDKD